MADSSVTKRMRERARELRRMMEMTHNPELRALMLKMAEQVETDAARLEGKGETQH